MLTKLESPIEDIVWKDPSTLTANDYNPNKVAAQELELLKFSLVQTGWIQPILVTHENVIIDGFHRWMIAKANHWLVPCVVMKLNEVERMMLTIRINRAKGTHVAFKMADIIKALVKEHGVPPGYIMKGIGATRDEINLLLLEDVFERFDVDNHKYNEATIPTGKK